MSSIISSDPRRSRLIRNAVVLLAAFLLGLLPPLVRTMQLKSELAETRTRLELAEVRELAALSYVEVTRNNFGVAAHHASSLFDRLDELSRTAQEPARSRAAEALARRDAVMGLLATADQGARVEMQGLVVQLLEAVDTTTRARRD
jgi:phage shock protein A